jgi:hypothetical protein
METIHLLVSLFNSNSNISTNEMIELLCIFGTKYNTLKKFEELVDKLVENDFSSLNKENICNLVNKLIEPPSKEMKFEFKSQISKKHLCNLKQVLELNSNDLLDISASQSLDSNNNSKWICRFSKVGTNEINKCAVEINIY